jgi:aminoglycoside phosphotransferase
MPSGFFPAVEPDAPVRPLVEGLRPAVEREMELHGGRAAAVHAELRADLESDGTAVLQRFYWSTQRADPGSLTGFAARTLYSDRKAPELRLHEFPSDPVLAWLADDDGPLRLQGRLEVLRYIPLRRVTFRLRDGADLPPVVIGKVKRDSGLKRAAKAFDAVHEAARRRPDGLAVPRVLRLDLDRHVLHLEHLPGVPMARAVPALGLRPAMERLGALHRGLQEADVEGLPARRLADWLTDARAAARRIAMFVPSAAARAQAVLDSLVRTPPEDGRLLYCQGDFLPGQILCDEDRWSVVDLDDSHLADPLAEVAQMYAGLARELALEPAQAQEARQAYLDAYADRAGEPLDEARWRWFLVAVELSLLGKRLMKGRATAEETSSVLERLSDPG